MSFKVIETQEYWLPETEWSVSGEFVTEEEAITFSILHYDTQLGMLPDEFPEKQCPCDMCQGLYRVTDYMSYVVKVING